MTKEAQQIKIEQGLQNLLAGENKRLTMVAALSIAVTAAFMLGVTKLELNDMLVRMYHKREVDK